MDWIEITIDTTAPGLDHLCARLVALGFPSFVAEDEGDFSQLLSGRGEYWDYIDEEFAKSRGGINRVRLYVGQSEAADTLALLKSGLEALVADLPEIDFGRLEPTACGRNEEEWATAWKKYYKPTPVGERLLIVPEWEKEYETGGRIVFLNNPGMSFGTGAHATTRLCIEALERLVEPGDDILDLGCGSGILSIIALLLGGGKAVAVDIDKNAVDIAQRNAALNSIEPGRYQGLAGDILTDEWLRKKVGGKKYRLVLANIVADVIIALCPIIPDLLEKDGIFILSGIISERADEVSGALQRAGLKIERTDRLDGWCAMSAGISGR